MRTSCVCVIGTTSLISHAAKLLALWLTPQVTCVASTARTCTQQDAVQQREKRTAGRARCIGGGARRAVMAMVRAGDSSNRPRRAVHAAERARPRLGVACPALPQRGGAAAEHDDLDARARDCNGQAWVTSLMCARASLQVAASGYRDSAHRRGASLHRRGGRK